MRIVLDTNVIISAILSPGSIPAKIIELVLDHSPDLILSQDILDEVFRVVKYPKLLGLMRRNGVRPEEIEIIIGSLKSLAILTAGELSFDIIKEDPTDNKILVCAIEGEADFIISEDNHLKGLGEFRGIPIVSPSVFLSVFADGNLHDNEG